MLLFGLGFSLCFHVSWMAVAEKLGGALERGEAIPLVDGFKFVRKDL